MDPKSDLAKFEFFSTMVRTVLGTGKKAKKERKKNDDSRDGSTAILVFNLRARGDRLAPTELQIGRMASLAVGSNPKTAARLPLSS